MGPDGKQHKFPLKVYDENADGFKTIQDAIAFGDASPEPEIAHLTDDVYSEEPAVLADHFHRGMRSRFGLRLREKTTHGTLWEKKNS